MKNAYVLMLRPVRADYPIYKEPEVAIDPSSVMMKVREGHLRRVRCPSFKETFDFFIDTQLLENQPDEAFIRMLKIIAGEAMLELLQSEKLHDATCDCDECAAERALWAARRRP